MLQKKIILQWVQKLNYLKDSLVSRLFGTSFIIINCFVIRPRKKIVQAVFENLVDSKINLFYVTNLHCIKNYRIIVFFFIMFFDCSV